MQTDPPPAASHPAWEPSSRLQQRSKPRGTLVNDRHSQLNPTLVSQIVSPASLEAIHMTIDKARHAGKTMCVAGGRHAMGAQQFGTDALLIDMTQRNRVLRFNPQHGTVEVEAGIQWPALIAYLHKVQQGWPQPWGIAQKQTGADQLSIGGAIAANAHGRGLRMGPLIMDVESLVLVDASGSLRTCNRRENAELFRLAIGGYGLFGIVSSVTLRLVPRQKLERVVAIAYLDDLLPAFERRIADGFLYGDFQFAIDATSDDFLRKGVFSCYRPVASATAIPSGHKELSDRQWRRLLYLAHVDKGQAFQRYAAYYLSTSGQVYWSDTHQLTTYLHDYHRLLERRLGAQARGTEIITEIYVPRQALTGFMQEVRADFRTRGVDVIYGTIRLIERDEESFLAWAKQPYACIIFNLHTAHTPTGLAGSADAFRRLIDMAIRRGGSYYLTYHKYATRAQVEACYPQFRAFLRCKETYDPEGRFQSDWYRHYRAMFAEG